VTRAGTLVENPYAWTRLANLVALEAPGGVGFSYCEAQKTGGHCAWDDKTTAAASANAIRDFFRKFPEVAANPFFITGESYAGVYCPTLAAELLGDVNLVGMAVGDPCTDNAAQKQSMDMLWYGHKHGFVPDDDFELLYHDCGSRAPRGAAPTLALAENATCLAAHRKFLLTTSKSFSQTWAEAFVNDVSLFGPAALVSFDQPGSLNYAQAQFLMRADVKEALHVASSPATAWPGPAAAWQYAWPASTLTSRCIPKTSDFARDFYRTSRSRVEMSTPVSKESSPEQTAI
jgi:cathepsin A (carboxypeptidase C)